MKPIKLIVSNKSKLQWKYGNKTTKVLALLNKIKATDKAKGLDTKIVFVDDAVSVKVAGVKKINPDLPKEYKRIIDDLYNKYVPAYILIFGAPDVIPFQDIDNPATDGDMGIPSDLPYACNTPYSSKISNFTGPLRVVGRLPDMMGQQQDISFIETLVNNGNKHKPLKPENYCKYFAVTAWVWRKSTQQTLQQLFGTPADLIDSPDGAVPKNYVPYTKQQLAPLSHFYNCHGAAFNTNFYGQKGQKFPEALQTGNLPGNVTTGSVVVAECCFGAQLFDSSQLGLAGPAIANNYLANGAIAFVGSSTIAYGPPDSNGLADLLTRYFMENVLKGASTGRAFLEARQRFLNEAKPDLDPLELKTLAQFYLLGDPSVQPAECEEAEVTSLSTGMAIANSRRNLFAKGVSLNESIGVTTKQRTTAPLTLKWQSGNEKLSVEKILKTNSFTQADKSAVYAVKPKAADITDFQKKMGGKNIRFHTYVQDTSDRINKIRVLVIKEDTKQILGWRLYVSR